MTPGRAPSLAASPEAAALRLELIDRAKDNGAPWATIGTFLGMTGREAKRHAHKLRDQVRRATVTAGPPASAPQGTCPPARS